MMTKKEREKAEMELRFIDALAQELKRRQVEEPFGSPVHRHYQNQVELLGRARAMTVPLDNDKDARHAHIKRA